MRNRGVDHLSARLLVCRSFRIWSVEEQCFITESLFRSQLLEKIARDYPQFDRSKAEARLNLAVSRGTTHPGKSNRLSDKWYKSGRSTSRRQVDYMLEECEIVCREEFMWRQADSTYSKPCTTQEMIELLKKEGISSDVAFDVIQAARERTHDQKAWDKPWDIAPVNPARVASSKPAPVTGAASPPRNWLQRLFDGLHRRKAKV